MSRFQIEMKNLLLNIDQSYCDLPMFCVLSSSSIPFYRTLPPGAPGNTLNKYEAQNRKGFNRVDRGINVKGNLLGKEITSLFKNYV